MENLGVETPLKKGPKPKRKRSVLQPSMFRGDIGFRECLTCQNYTPHCCILIVVSLYCEFLDGSSGFQLCLRVIYITCLSFFNPISSMVSMLPIRMPVFEMFLTQG